jgi:cold shock protein
MSKTFAHLLEHMSKISPQPPDDKFRAAAPTTRRDGRPAPSKPPKPMDGLLPGQQRGHLKIVQRNGRPGNPTEFFCRCRLCGCSIRVSGQYLRKVKETCDRGDCHYGRGGGYGFITAEDGTNVFIHISQVELAGLKTLERGQRVEFTAYPSPRGAVAEKLKVIR